MLNSPISYNVTQEVFTAEECKEIIEYGIKHGSEVQGKIGGKTPHNNDKLILDQKVRDTKLYFFSHKETYDKLMPYIGMINQDSLWNFDLEQVEPLQLSIYENTGHYDWHIDVHPYPYPKNSGPFEGLVRKISFSIMLNNKEEYEGGDFEIEDKLPNFNPRSHVVEDLDKCGAMLTFPSYIPHKVHKVTSGTRYSLVGWVAGKPWR